MRNRSPRSRPSCPGSDRRRAGRHSTREQMDLDQRTPSLHSCSSSELTKLAGRGSQRTLTATSDGSQMRKAPLLSGRKASSSRSHSNCPTSSLRGPPPTARRGVEIGIIRGRRKAEPSVNRARKMWSIVLTSPTGMKRFPMDSRLWGIVGLNRKVPHPRLSPKGTASKATVSRGAGESNGTVPCHMYDGNSTSRPSTGCTCRAGATPGAG